jgi:hypothetical protein
LPKSFFEPQSGLASLEWLIATGHFDTLSTRGGGLFCPLFPKIRKRTALFEGSQTLPIILLIKVVMLHWRKDMTRTSQVLPLEAHSLCIQIPFVPRSKQTAVHYKDTLIRAQ